MAVIVVPGGGNQKCYAGPEGVDVADWLNKLGINAFVERYRLLPYDSTVDALADTQQSFRIVRAACEGMEHRSESQRRDHGRLGRRGAGRLGDAQVRRRQSGCQRSDRAGKLPARFFGVGLRRLAQDGSEQGAEEYSANIHDQPRESTTPIHARRDGRRILQTRLFKAKIPTELHIYGHGGHGGAISPRKGIPFGTWQDRFVDWAKDLGLMKNKQ